MSLFRRFKGRDPDYDFFDRFGDPSKPSAGTIPITNYPDIAIDAATQIRVVQVLPGGFEDEVCCQLDVKTLSGIAQTPDLQFSALSYTWGGFVNHASITLNGVPGFPISQNLYCCLQRIRSMGKNQSLPLWIDQICINQHDKKEKDLQVPLMEDIYKQATQVIIWLGDHAPGFELALSRSSQLEKIIDYSTHGRLDMGLCWWRRLWYASLSRDLHGLTRQGFARILPRHERAGPTDRLGPDFVDGTLQFHGQVSGGTTIRSTPFDKSRGSSQHDQELQHGARTGPERPHIVRIGMGIPAAH